jgi:N-succinyldiaminopimelate aminotransferase
MPRHPEFAGRITSVLAGSFGTAPRAPEPPSGLTRLHIGDSAESPGGEIELAGRFSKASEYWYRYPAPAGTGRLRRALADYYSQQHGLPTAPEQILVTPGATSALNTLVNLLCDADDEVLVLTPSWPLFPGMTRLTGATVVELPFHDAVTEIDAREITRRLEAAISRRTVLIYLNTPNNPSGTLMNPEQCAAVVDVARRHQLWLISDEAYDGMAFDGRRTPTVAGLAHDDDRVLVVSTFSKMHRAAGLRLGWIRGAIDHIRAATRVATFQVYSASTVAQVLVEPAVRTRPDWAPAVLAALQERRDRFMDALGLDLPAPDGTYFVFVDLRPWCGQDFNAVEAAEELLAAGICVTPGIEFGSAYQSWIRVCFASEPMNRTRDAGRQIGAWVRNRAFRRS